MAGVAISFTIGQEGIFSRAQDAVVINENASIYEQLQMVVVDYKMDGIETKDNQTIIERLKADGYANEDNSLNVEHLMGRKMQTGNGSIENGDIYVLELREKTSSNTSSDIDYYLIYYNDKKEDRNLGLAFENEKLNIDSNVKITISKIPETEPAGNVYLKVEKVEGINNIININEIDITKLNEDSKIGLAFVMFLSDNDMNYITFKQFLDSNYLTQDEFLSFIISNLDSIIEEKMASLNEKGIETVSSYLILNHENELSDYYRTNQNGRYTFKVKEILTNKTYEQTVEVNNIDESIPAYYVEGVIGLAELHDIDKSVLEFEKAYIIYEGERIDVTDCIFSDEDDFGVSLWDTAKKLERSGKIEDDYDISGTTQIFEIVKDERRYFGEVTMLWPV